MRIRGNRVRVYSGSSYTLRFTATVSGFSGGYAGYRSDKMCIRDRYGVTDFGADFDYREIVVSCSIFPRHSFPALVSTLDDICLLYTSRCV